MILANQAAIKLLFLTGLVLAQPAGREIMERVDALPSPRDMVSKLKMTLISSRGGKLRQRSRELITYERHYDSGKFKSKSLIRFFQPAEVKGTGFLTWDRRGNRSDDQWLYLPALKKVKRIRAKEKSKNFLGTDFTYEDLAGRSTDEDEYEYLGDDLYRGSACYKVKAIPKDGTTDYGNRIIWVDKKNWLLKRVEFFDRQGKRLKILEIPDHVRNGKYWTATTLIMENVSTGHKTLMKVLSVEYDQGLKDEIFTESFLKRP